MQATLLSTAVRPKSLKTKNKISMTVNCKIVKILTKASLMVTIFFVIQLCRGGKSSPRNPG